MTHPKTFSKTFTHALLIGLSVVATWGCATSPVQQSAEKRSLSNVSREKPVVQGVVRIATVQYPVEGGLTTEAFIVKMRSFVREAKAEGATLVVFPELAVLDTWPNGNKDSEEKIVGVIADQVTPKILQELERMSREEKIAVLAGSAPRRVGKKIRNTAFLFFPDGSSVLHDKVFLTAWERKMGWEAGNDVKAFDTPWGKTVILICYDIEFPVMAETLAKLKPEVLLVPSMTESVAGLQRVRWAAQARAVELHAFVLVSGTVGKVGDDWIHYGQNAIISPRDRLFPAPPVEGQADQPGLVFGDLDLPLLRESRNKSDFYPARDQTGRVLNVKYRAEKISRSIPDSKTRK